MLDSDPKCDKVLMKWLSTDDVIDRKRFHFMPNGGLQSLTCDGKVVGDWPENGSEIFLRIDENKSNQKWELLNLNQNLLSVSKKIYILIFVWVNARTQKIKYSFPIVLHHF